MRDRIIEIGKDSIWYFLCSILSALIGFLAVPILTRIFSPYDYGIYALVTTTIVLVSPLFHSWFISSAVRYYPEYEKRGELDVFYSTMFHYIPHFLMLFAAVILPLAIFVLPLGEFRLIICLGIAIFALFTVFNVCLGVMRAMQMAWQYTVLFVFVQFCRYLVGAGIAVWFSAGIAGPFWGWLGGLIVIIPVEFIMLKTWKYFRWSKKSNKLLKEFFSFGFVLIITTFLAEILSTSDRYMVQWLKGAFQVGLYSVVYTLVNQVSGLLVGFLKMASGPVLIKVYEREGEENAVILINRITRYFLLLLIPTCTGLYVLRKPILDIITTPEYFQAESVVLPLVLGIFLNVITWIPLLAFLIKKKTIHTLLPMTAAAVLNIVLNLLFIPRLGYTGAAWATFISYVVGFIFITLMSVRLMRWDFPWIGTLKICIADAVMLSGIYGLGKLDLDNLVGLILTVTLAAIIYLSTLLAIKGFSKSELVFTIELLRNIPGIGTLLPTRREKKR
ncbi:MAG: oligosaccharide flippase family protein [Actinobacteria bacterium]|nr:oligosaccharide flippase family protein [Actinomycetota bacterium]